MVLVFQFFLLVVGLLCLWKGGEWAVRYAIGLSEIYGVAKFKIGFFIFAISTGLPEICSAVVSSWKGVPEVSAGDLMGSSLVNITLILGIVLLYVKKVELESPLRIKLFQTIVLMTVLFVGIAYSPAETRLTGLLLIIIYLGSFFWFQAGIPKKAATKEIGEVEESIEKIEEKATLPPKVDVLLKLVGSLAFLLLSSWITVYSAAEIAAQLGVDLTIIGATLIAVGTSVPELALGIHAIKQREYDLALGNIFGSSLLNVSLIMGILIMANPKLNLLFARQLLPFLFAVVIWVMQKFLRKQPLRRLDGVICLAIFGLYLGWMISVAMR